MFKLKLIIQILFTVAFLAMIITGKTDLWMFVFLGSTIGAIFFGRFYCGWVCPINTMIDGVNTFNKKHKYKRKKVPIWLAKPIVRYVSLFIFVGIMVFTVTSGQKIPILAILVVLGTALSIIFIPAFWHRYLCPYGVLLSLTGTLARYYWQINNNSCTKCGICKKVCHAEAINMENKKDYPTFDKKYCLQCLECVKVCPKSAINICKAPTKNRY